MISESDIGQLSSLMTAFPGEERLLQDEPMSLHTSFGVGGKAEVYIDAVGEELEKLVPFLREKNIPYTVIGAGSNLLAVDLAHSQAGAVEVGHRDVSGIQRPGFNAVRDDTDARQVSGDLSRFRRDGISYHAL